MNTPAAGARHARSLTAAVLAVILALHLVRLLAFFGGLDPLLSPEPLLASDHGYHYYFTVAGSRCLLETGFTSCYDPSIMAGHPTDVLDSSDRLLKVLLAVLPLPDAVAYKVVVFFTGAVVPLVFFFSARRFGRDRLESLLASAGGVWVWWSGIGSVLFEIGMTGFLLASALVWLVVGRFRNFLDHPGPGSAAALAVGLWTGLLVHTGIALLIALPAAALLFLRRRQLDARSLGWLAAAGAVALNASYFWLVPFLTNLKYINEVIKPLQVPQMFLGMLLLTLVKGNLAPVWIAVGAVLGLRRWRKEGETELGLVFSLTLALLAFIFLLGNMLPVVRETEPVRFAVPMFFAACLPAAAWLAGLVRDARGPGSAGRARVILAVASLSLVISFARPARDPSAHPLVGIEPEAALVRDWILRSTDRSARVMVEDRGPITPIFGSSYPLAYIRFATGREIIGGPHWGTFLLQHYADFSGGTMFGRLVDSWDGPWLAEEMRRFNIGWVAARSPLNIARLERFPDLFVPLGEEDNWHFYRCTAARGFVVEGGGRVTSVPNGLRVERAAPRRGKVVLSYHWHPDLQVDPPRRLFRAPAGADPVGFVGVEGEGGDYDIRLRYSLFPRREP